MSAEENKTMLIDSIGTIIGDNNAPAVSSLEFDNSHFEEITGTKIEVVVEAHKALGTYQAVTALATAEMGNQHIANNSSDVFEATFEVCDGLSFHHVFKAEEEINGEVHHNRLRAAFISDFGDDDDLTGLAIQLAHEISEEGYLSEDDIEITEEVKAA